MVRIHDMTIQLKIDKATQQFIQRLTINAEVLAERRRQDEKWGEQNHEDPVWAAILTEEVGEASQALLHDMFGGDHAGTLRTEVIHVAAVALQWLECLDRKAANSD